MLVKNNKYNKRVFISDETSLYNEVLFLHGLAGQVFSSTMKEMSFKASSHVKFACCGCFFVLFSTVLLCVKLVSPLALYCMVCCRGNTRSVFGYQSELYHVTHATLG